jgi:uncharacterized protein YkwD
MAQKIFQFCFNILLFGIGNERYNVCHGFIPNLFLKGGIEMKKMNSFIGRTIAFVLVTSMILGTNTSFASATVDIEPTIRIGENDPMTRDEFLAWGSQRGIRHFNIEGRIYPLGIIFRFNNGQTFTYGELNGHILYVFHRPDVMSAPRIVRLQGNYAADNDFQSHGTATPMLFYSRAPIPLSHDELTTIMANAPVCPMHTRSNITLSNHRLTEAELSAWIDEYNEMGGASAFELAVVREVNRVRAEYGLYPLALSPALMMSARLKTQEFGDLQYFGHYSPVHGTVTDAARMFGFEGIAGENITRTGSNSSSVPVFKSTPERVVGGMLASTRGHRDILLAPTAHSVGVGAFFSPNSTGALGNLTYSFYFATKFGFE